MSPATTPRQRRRHDWSAIKAAYVEGVEINGVRNPIPTLDEIAARFDIHVSVVRKCSMRETWTDQRDLFTRRLEESKQQKTTEVLASKGAEFDALSLRVAEKLFKKIEKRLDEALREAKPVDITPNQAAALATAAKSAQHVGRLVMGDSTDNARLYAELLQKPDLSALSPAELEQLEALLGKARPAP